MMRPVRNLPWILGVMLIVSAPVGLAQFETAGVLGTVRDPSGAVIVGATVTLISQDTGIEAKTTTDELGNYSFLTVRVGRYTITAEAPGFAKFSTSDVVVNVNARQRVDITMQPGAVTEIIEVRGVASALQTDSSEKSHVVQAQQIVELPLNGRNFSELALLAPNIRKSPIAMQTVTPREGAFNVNGMRSTYNNFLLDGMDNNAYSTSNQGFSNQVAIPSPDAVAEFKVVTSNFSAEYGRVGGAVVNVVMRSGTNRFHLTAYEFLRNTRLNAVGFFRPAGGVKPTLNQNQFGFTIGGPFVKNRLFYFADYEGFRQIRKALFIATIPNMNDRAGILPVTVYNPLTGRLYPAGTPVEMTPFARKVLSELPPVPAGTGRTNNYQLLRLTPREFADKYDAKLDGQIRDNMSGFLRWSQRKSNAFYAPFLEGPSGGSGDGYVRVMAQSAAAGYTWTVSPTSLLELRLGFTRILAGKQPPFLGGRSMEELYGVPGLPTSRELTGGLNTQNISGFTTGIIGRQATNPQFQNPKTWNPKVNYSRVVGRHTLKVGGELQIIHTQVMDINPVYGLLGYAGQFSRPTCALLGQPAGCPIPADPASYNLADFMFGLPSQIQLANWLVGNYRQRMYFLYLQDDFRVTPKLTLNLGLRWEFATPRWERDNVLSNFDPVTVRMVQARPGGLAERALVNPDYRDWGPRFGVAYSVTPKLVLRGGYGISYAFHNRMGSADLLGMNGPQVNWATIDQSIPPGGPVPAGFRTIYTAFPPGMTSPANFDPVRANVAYIPRDTRWPYVQTWFASVQRELPGSWIVELGYTGNHSLRLPVLSDYNQAYPNRPGQNLGIQARRPIPTFGPITWVNPAGQTVYHGLSVRTERRMGTGLYFLNSFTWSKALGNSEQALEANATVQNIRDLRNERGPTSYDSTIINVTTAIYELPFGKGRRFGAGWGGLLNAIAGGWQISGINFYYSGRPVNIIYTPTSAMDVTGRLAEWRGGAQQRPNLVGNPARPAGADKVTQYWNRAAFAVPPVDAPFGTLGRNALRGPDFWQWDVGINKNFRLPAREGTTLQFRAEFFNILNRTNFEQPANNISAADFGTLRSAYAPRQIQFALKLMF
ncbi:MAG: TonB-dependent receptor [Bryobacterales bacterium]|nr:TonB-dependent receptor [Bryobacterales bacterium]